MKNTIEKLKRDIKHLVEKKVKTTQERVAFKRKASPEFKQSPEYRDWFGPRDEVRADCRYEIRHRLLAYAFLRGKSYKVVEKKCAEDNKPSVSSIKRVLDWSRAFESVEDCARFDELISEENIQEWLDSSLIVGCDFAVTKDETVTSVYQIDEYGDVELVAVE